MNRLECLIIGLFIPLLVWASGKNDIHKREIAYLKDFAEIYGTVRWFMPSDEARNMDWDALCLYGADKILECRTDEEFYSTLESIYSGIIPMFEIDKGEKSAQMDSYYADSHDAMNPVYWQHAGVELSIFSNKYSSKRVNRENDSYSLNRFAVLGYLPIVPKNNTLRVVFRVKSVPVDESYLSYYGIVLNSKLRLAFRKALVSQSGKYEALRQLMSEINDAHISYMNFSDNYRYFFPARIKLVNKKAVVAEPYVPELQKGDILLSLNGNRSMNIVKYFTSLRSGSRHSKVPEAEAYAFNAQDSVAGCRIRRAGRKLDMNVRMIEAESYYYRLYTSYENLLNRNKSRYINDSILYLNPGISGLDEIKTMLEQHAQGSPVIIDLRFSSTFLIRYIMPLLWNGVEFYEKRPVTFIPEVSFLNTNNEVPDSGRKHRKSRKDCNTNIVFLINSSVISNQEEFLDYVKYNGMACLVGENTAGICGNINVIPLPSNKMVVFTGERYYSVAGMSGDYFKKGVDPDIRVIQTKKNIFNDKDLFLQKAISFFVNNH